MHDRRLVLEEGSLSTEHDTRSFVVLGQRTIDRLATYGHVDQVSNQVYVFGTFRMQLMKA